MHTKDLWMENEYGYVYDGMNAFEREVKRWFDFFAALLCLIIFSPLFLLCYIAIKRDDGGPVIYKQIRIGRFGRPFYIYKFRSMRTDAEDELPQFWNVLRGDMSFVGPRPERRFYIRQIMERDPRYEYLYQIRPGITSMATIYNGYTDTIEKMLKRLEMDLDYLGKRSWWLDFKIIALTFLNIAFGKKF